MQHPRHHQSSHQQPQQRHGGSSQVGIFILHCVHRGLEYRQGEPGHSICVRLCTGVLCDVYLSLGESNRYRVSHGVLRVCSMSLSLGESNRYRLSHGVLRVCSMSLSLGEANRDILHQFFLSKSAYVGLGSLRKRMVANGEV